METLIERYKDKISGVLTCADRIVITGTLPVLSNPKSMTGYMFAHNIRIFDYAIFAEPFRNQIRENAEKIAKANNLEVEFLRKSTIRKETIISKILEKRGLKPGLVHILSVVEGCLTYEPWYNKQTGKTYFKGRQSKCLTYYFIEELLGLCYVRVPTWLPFRLQIYFKMVICTWVN